WEVMDRLRRDPATQSIPVHFISAVDASERGMALGAVGYLTKPVTRADLIGAVRTLVPSVGTAFGRVLVVEDSVLEGELIVEILRKQDVEAIHVRNAGVALGVIENEYYGCIILDLGLLDMDGLGLLETLRARIDFDMLRVVVHTKKT